MRELKKNAKKTAHFQIILQVARFFQMVNDFESLHHAKGEQGVESRMGGAQRGLSNDGAWMVEYGWGRSHAFLVEELRTERIRRFVQ